MKVKVKMLRRNGARLSDREIGADPGVEGSLTLYKVASDTELKLSRTDDSRMEPLVPILHDAKLVLMHGNSLLFSGLNRAGERESTTYLQEWSVKVQSL
jgi:hypothetical protein